MMSFPIGNSKPGQSSIIAFLRAFVLHQIARFGSVIINILIFIEGRMAPPCQAWHPSFAAFIRASILGIGKGPRLEEGLRLPDFRHDGGVGFGAFEVAVDALH